MFVITVFFLLFLVLLGSHLWIHCQIWLHADLPLYFLPRFLVFCSYITFRSLTHFKLIFVYSCEVREQVPHSQVHFIPLHVSIQVSQYHLLKRLFFFYWIALALLSNISWLETHGFISRLLIKYHWSIYVSYEVQHCLDYCHFAWSFEIWKCESSKFVLLFPDLFCLFWVTCDSIWILGSSSPLPQKSQ